MQECAGPTAFYIDVQTRISNNPQPAVFIHSFWTDVMFTVSQLILPIHRKNLIRINRSTPPEICEFSPNFYNSYFSEQQRAIASYAF